MVNYGFLKMEITTKPFASNFFDTKLKIKIIIKKKKTFFNQID